MKGNGNYIKLYRETLQNPIVTKDADHLAIWMWLLMTAVWKPKDVIFNGQRVTLRPGQMTTGRKKISTELCVSESKVQRVLKAFESEHMIEQVTDHRCRLISIVSWNKYQGSEQVSEQEVNSFRTSSEQVLNTNKERKKERKKEYIYSDKLPPEVSEAMKAYEEMRRKKKWDFGDRARKMFMNKLDELSCGSDAMKVRLIDEATLRNWRSVYMTDEIASEMNFELFETLWRLGAKSVRTESKLKERGHNGAADTYSVISLKDEAYKELPADLKKFVKDADGLKSWFIANRSDKDNAKKMFLKEYGRKVQ